MRKRILTSLFCLIVVTAIIAQTEQPDNSVAQNLEDFEFALHELESNYAGFETQITEANRQQYDSIVATLRNQIETQKVAFIIDANNGSATEELLIQAKAISDRTTIYGIENTGGCLDYSSTRETALPNSKFPIYIPIARSCRLPDKGIDKTGIAPDIIIPIDYPQSLTDNLDEWTVWVTQKMENKL